MGLPYNVVIQCALTPSELPPWVAKRIGCMYLKRYRPNPGLEGQKAFKEGLWEGVLAWAVDDQGVVLGWALKALPRGSQHSQVMVFVRKKSRRQGVGDALLDTCRKWGPKGPVVYYPHDPDSTAFYKFRDKKYSRGI